MMNKVIAEAANQICGLKKANRALIVGINGVDTSGKTDFAIKLEEELSKRGHEILIVQAKDFYNPKSYRYSSVDEVENYYNRTISFRRLIHEVLEPIKSEGAMNREVLLLDVETDQYSIVKRYVADQSTIVLVEGRFLFRKKLNDYFDYKIFLNISFDEMIKRAETIDMPRIGNRKDVMERFEKKCVLAQKYYIDQCDPVGRADFVIDATDLGNLVVEKV